MHAAKRGPVPGVTRRHGGGPLLREREIRQERYVHHGDEKEDGQPSRLPSRLTNLHPQVNADEKIYEGNEEQHNEPNRQLGHREQRNEIRDWNPNQHSRLVPGLFADQFKAVTYEDIHPDRDDECIQATQ